MTGPFDNIDLEHLDLTKLDQAEVSKLFDLVPDEEVDRVVAALRAATAKETSSRQMLDEALAALQTIGGLAIKVAAAV